jgi:hypothetical protein
MAKGVGNIGSSNDLLTGEYGATQVLVTADGSSTRVAFGRMGPRGPVYYLAVLLSQEAAGSLLEQLDEQTK